MEACKPILNTGLRGFVIAQSRICDVDGANGRLIYRGYLIQDLAKRASFEETAYLLLYEKLPDKAELEEFRRRIRAQQGPRGGRDTCSENGPRSVSQPTLQGQKSMSWVLAIHSRGCRAR